MRSLGSVSVRSVARRKGRYALTTIGNALGVGIVFAVVVTSAATTQALDRFVTGFTGKADAVVTTAGAFDSELPPGIVEAVRDDPGVGASVERFGFRSARELRGENVDPFADFLNVSGFDFAEASVVHDFDVARGRLPRAGEREVLTTPVLDVPVGDEIALATATGRTSFEVVGVLAENGAALANGGRVAYTHIDVARRVQEADGGVNQIDVVLRDGVDSDSWIDSRRDALGEGAIVQDASDLASGFRQFLQSVQGALLLTAVIALFVGAFLIYLTFSVSVAERTRFFGTLRALGAQPRQIRRLVTREALLLGLVASIAGLGLGYVVALGSLGLVGSLLEIGDVSLENPWTAAGVSLLLGVGAAVVSSVVPARRAARLSPVAAMRDEGVAGNDSIRVWPRVAVLAAGVALSLAGPGVALRGLGLVLVMLGAVVLVPLVLRPLARVLGRITARISRGVGDVAVAHLAKERSRSAYTLALIMVVLASIFAIGAANASMANTLDDVVEDQFGSDLQIGAPSHFPAEFAEELDGVDGIRARTELRFGFTQLVDDGDPAQVFMVAVDPDTYFEVSSFPWVDGDDADARRSFERGSHVVLAAPLADRVGVEVGDPVTIRTQDGPRRFTLAGTYAVLGFNDGIVVSHADAARFFGATEPMGYFLDVDDGHTVEAVGADLRARLGDRFDFELETAADVKEFATGQLRGFFGIGYAVLLVSTVIGFLGLANTLIVSVIQRTREIGILRSTGVLRSQLRWMVLAEAATLVLVAFVLSVGLGLAITQVVVDSFSASLGFTVEFLWPWALVPLVLVVAVVGGVLAALAPARRAARLDPVVALRFD